MPNVNIKREDSLDQPQTDRKAKLPPSRRSAARATGAASLLKEGVILKLIGEMHWLPRQLPTTIHTLIVLTLGIVFGLIPGVARATNHIVKINEISAGLNGDANNQYVVLEAEDDSQKQWGPNGGAISRAMLLFFDASGNQTGQFLFPSDPPGSVGPFGDQNPANAATTVLLATQAFTDTPGNPVPDFIIPPLVNPMAGKVAFVTNPGNRAFDIDVALSYGGALFTGNPGATVFALGETFGPGAADGPNANQLPVQGNQALTRINSGGFGNGFQTNADFALAPRNPRNTLGQSLGPEIQISTTSLNFGTRDVAAGPTTSQTITIQNVGLLNALTITSVNPGGINANQFTIVSDSGEPSLGPNATRTIVLAFDPSSVGFKSATLRVVSNDTDEGLVNVALTGTGTDLSAPEIDVSPVSVGFGSQDVNAGPSISHVITIANLGTVNSLTLASVIVSDPGQFTVLTDTGQTVLGPGAVRTMTLAFDPSTVGSKFANLRIQSNDSNEGIVDVPLSGLGIDPCGVLNPANSIATDLCAAAQPVCPGVVFTGTTVGANNDGSAACGSSSTSPDVWFRYTPSGSGTLTISLAGSSFDTVLSAHTGCPGTTANEVACNDDFGGFGTSQLVFQVTSGGMVFIRIAGFGGATGNFQMTLNGPPCASLDQNNNGVADDCESDFGDAPAPYPTLLADGGPRHLVGSGLFLGSLVDIEPDGQPTAQADGDDLNGSPNDEDGVTFTTALVAGQTAGIQVIASAPGLLSAWIDFNADGDWTDPDEQIFADQPLVAGVNSLSFAVPAGARRVPLTFARFRLSSAAGLSLSGPAPDGEVEDYAVVITAPPSPDLCAAAQPVCPGVVFAGTTVGANNDGSAACGSSSTSPDVWFHYTPSGSGTLTISLAGSSFDTVLSAHAGCPGTTANQIACNDDVGGFRTSQLNLPVTSGVIVLIRIAGFNGQTGNFQMTLNGPPCALANTVPTISAIADVTTEQDKPTPVIPFIVTDKETALGFLVVTAESSNTTLIPVGNIVLSGSGGSRTVFITPAVGQVGSSTITLTVRDGGNPALTDSTSFKVTATPPPPPEMEVRINEVMAGLNGDSSIQFVELEANGNANKGWGPGAAIAGRAMLVFFDKTGNQTGRYVFPHDAPNGADTVLVATHDFADVTGITPDFIMPKEIMPLAGKVAFRSNPDNAQFDINLALAYGGNDFSGSVDGAGPANANSLPILGAQSLTRMQNFPFGVNENAAFQLATPTPVNTAGKTVAVGVASLREQGQNLFFRETFNGNGRTCFTCHLPQDQFGLKPATISSLASDDPLFVNEFNVNTLVLTGRSQPSDLRGTITGNTGSAKVLAGTDDHYLIYGGNNLSGTLTDAAGNTGTFQSFIVGNLNGPTASNNSARGLEDPVEMRGARGLVLENIDGFQALEVFRASPHLLNIAHTAPYGLSGDIPDLDVFCEGAVRQHFPQSMARVVGVDFRLPTAQELQAMTAFMNSISNPSDQDFSLARFVTTAAQKRGFNAFFDTQGKCFTCHSGPVLAHSAATIAGFSIAGMNDNFDTGVANRAINGPGGDNLPTEPAGLQTGHSTRRFNTPTLFGIKLTAPFFHDGSAATLTEAVQFYDTREFLNSPAGQVVGPIAAAANSQTTVDIVAFLESLIEIPVGFTRELDFGVRGVADLSTVTLNASVTNSGPGPLTITQVIFNGANSTEFNIVNDTDESQLAPGQIRVITVGLVPVSFGSKAATLEITANDNQTIGAFSFGVALTAVINQVAGRFVFYNQSKFDGNNAAANSADDAAIAPDKTALLSGQTASFANYTSYSHGVNGIMIDIANVAGTPSVADFLFKVGNDNTPGTWGAAPSPSSVTVRPGAGVGGSTRITVIWPHDSIRKTWLQVTVLASAATGLAAPDVFYFGNAVGESGNSAMDAAVGPADELRARSNPQNVVNPALITCLFDYDRDGAVDPRDQLIARSNGTSVLNRLKLISVP
jgi:cytochrome c peroxidase